MNDWTAETAEWYAEKYGEYATNRLAVDALHLAPDATIVDVGCGTGAALRHAAARITDGQLIGIDPVPRMVEIARERTADHPHASRIEYRAGGAEDLPLDDDFADWILAFDSFDHWRDQAKGLAEARRVLCPDGRLVVVKDHDVPGGDKTRRAFLDSIVAAGFEVESEQLVEEQDVTFTIWVCR